MRLNRFLQQLSPTANREQQSISRKTDQSETTTGMEFANQKTFKHCEAPLCHQLDFLPFHCKECNHTFCSEHQSWKNHHCAVGLRKLQGRIAVSCSKCDMMVSQLPGKSAEETMELHQSNPKACTSAATRAKMKKKKRRRCNAKGCKESIRASYMQFHCKQCHSKFCVKHRSATDHQCQAIRAQHYVALAKDRRVTSRAHAKSESGPGRMNSHRPSVSAY